MNNNNNPERNKLIEQLCQEINNTLVRSGPIRKILLELREKKLISEQEFIILTINCNLVLDGVITNKDKAPKERREIPQGRRETDVPACPQIDGQKLSEQEIKFAEFCAEKFDENQWLKKNNISKGQPKIPLL